MSETAILAAARAAVAAALPDVPDWSENPNKLDPKHMPAFTVDVERLSSEPTAAGSETEDVELTITVDLFQKYSPSQSGRALAGTQAETARAALLGDVTLQGLTYWRQGGAFNTDTDPGEHRFATATATVAVRAEF